MNRTLVAIVTGAVGSAAAACTPPSGTTTGPGSAPKPPEPAPDASVDRQSADALDRLFQDGSADQIAETLEAMVNAPDAGAEAGPDARADAKSDAKPDAKAGLTPLERRNMVPVYKGVSFS